MSYFLWLMFSFCGTVSNWAMEKIHSYPLVVPASSCGRTVSVNSSLLLFILLIFLFDIIQKSCLFRKSFGIWLKITLGFSCLCYESLFKKFSCVIHSAVVNTGKCMYTARIILAVNRTVKGINTTGLVLLEPVLFSCVSFEQRGWSSWSPEVFSSSGYSTTTFSLRCAGGRSEQTGLILHPLCGYWRLLVPGSSYWTASICFIITLCQFCGANGKT